LDDYIYTVSRIGQTLSVFYHNNISTDLNIPIYNTYSTSSTVDFNCTSYAKNNLKNSTLFVWNATSIINNSETNSITGISNVSSFNVILPIDDNYIWNCYACTTNDECAFADFNYTFLVDSAFPLISITSPINGTTLLINTSDINYTVSDANLDSCWYSNDTMSINTTISCGTNITDIVWTEGPHNVTIWTNDSANNINSSSITFTIDTIPPVTSIDAFTSPPDGAEYTNGTWTASNVKATMSAYDAVSGVDTLSYPIYCLDTTNTCDPNTFISAGVTITTEGVSYLRYYSNDTAGNNESINERTIKIDSTAPNLTITTPTNYINSTDIYLDVNYTASDANLDSCWFSNDTMTLNITLASCTTNITWMNWTEGPHNITIWANDSVNNVNMTTITFTIDITSPVANLSSPLNNSFNFTLAQNFTFNVSDNLGVSNSTLYIWNTTGEFSSTNSTFISSVVEDTVGIVVTLIEGIYTWWVQIWDWSGNTFTTDNRTLTIDITYPQISIAFPTNYTNSTYSMLDVNYTATDTYLGSCWYSNDTMSLNITLANCQTNLTGLNWTEGPHNVTIWTNDSANNVNWTSVIFTIDTTAPTLVIDYPADTESYSTNVIDFNFTIIDATIGLDTCWYANDTLELNTTIDCTTNITINHADGANLVIYLWANDTLGNEAGISNTYSISTASPAITLKKPVDEGYLNSSIVVFNYTATDTDGLDTCELWGNWTGTWHKNLTNVHDGDTSVDINEGNFSQTIIDGGYKWNVWCNDSNPTADFSANNHTFIVDTLYPQVSYGDGTNADELNSTSTELYINVSVTEVNEDTITFTIHNSTGNYNTTTYTDSTRIINITNIPDGTYTYNVTVNDSVGFSNTTLTRIIRLDDTSPTLTILNPLPQNYGTNNSMSLNYTALDNVVGLDTCWYYVKNSSGTTKASNTLSNCENDTFSLPGGDIEYTLHLFTRDLLLNAQTTTVTFGIRTISPVVVLTTVNNTHTNTLINNYFNFTVESNADNISNCGLYGDWSGWHLNETITTPSESTDTNFEPVNFTEGGYLWNVYCTDNFGYSDFALNNNTYIVDLTNPGISIINITTQLGFQTFDFNTTVTDTYLSTTTCKYSIFNSSGGIDGVENISTTCNFQVSGTSTDYDTYNLTVYAIDKAGNENSSTNEFTTTPSSPEGSTGAGAQPEPIEIIVGAEGVCGNGLCEPDLGELFWNCPIDCGGINLDDLILSCFDDDPLINQKCITKQASVLFYLAVLLIVVTAIAMVVRIPSVKKRVKKIRILSKKQRNQGKKQQSFIRKIKRFNER